ncbi:MAG: InlB B-repeat-containing protein [Bifidobacteriaceae bacterium]|nr:InlB B-repeat-containing protein [Bifidobacteriaceae bacterium]
MKRLLSQVLAVTLLGATLVSVPTNVNAAPPTNFADVAQCYNTSSNQFEDSSNSGKCGGQGSNQEAFVLEVVTTASNQTAYIPVRAVSTGPDIYNVSYNWDINWGDTTEETKTGVSDNPVAFHLSHQYTTAGTYNIVITPKDDAALGWLDAFGRYSSTTYSAGITRILTPFPELSRTPRANAFYQTFQQMQDAKNLPENLFWGINTSQLTDFSNMFSSTFSNYAYKAAALTDVTIPENLFSELDTTSGITFSNMFNSTFTYYAHSNTAATSIAIPEDLFESINTSNGTTFTSMFSNTFDHAYYSNVNAVTAAIPEGLFSEIDTSNGTTLNSMFQDTFTYYAYSNTAATDVSIPEDLFESINTSSATNQSSMFNNTFFDYAYSNTTDADISIPAKLFQSIDTETATNLSYMFSNTFNNYAYLDTAATDISIPEGLFDTIKTPKNVTFNYMFRGTFNGYASNAPVGAKQSATIPEELFEALDFTAGTLFSNMFQDTFLNYANQRKVTFDTGQGSFTNDPDNPQTLSGNAFGVKADNASPSANPTLDKNSKDIKPAYNNNTGLTVQDPGVPQLQNSAFKGWYLDADFYDPFDLTVNRLFASDTSTEVSDATLYAKFQILAAQTVPDNWESPVFCYDFTTFAPTTKTDDACGGISATEEEGFILEAQVEENDEVNIPVAGKTHNNAFGVPYNWRVDWDDGRETVTGEQISAASKVITHKYTEEGTYQIRITPIDIDATVLGWFDAFGSLTSGADTKITRILTPFSALAKTPRPYAFYETFYNFQNMQNLPANLFISVDTKNVQDFSYMFHRTFANYARVSEADDLAITDDLFNTIDTSNGTNFSLMFCQTFSDFARDVSTDLKLSLTIPLDLFADLVVSNGTTFTYMFEGTFGGYANIREVTFDLDGGTLPDDPANPQTLLNNTWGVKADNATTGLTNPQITKDSTNIKPSYNVGLSVTNPGNPTKADNLFRGWYLDSNFEFPFNITTDKVYTSDISTLETDVHLYAKFISDSSVYVPDTWADDAYCYDFNAGTSDYSYTDPCGGNGSTDKEGFILEATVEAGDDVLIPVAGKDENNAFGVPYNWSIDWDDDAVTETTELTSARNKTISHKYQTAGTYQIKITPAQTPSSAGWFDAFGGLSSVDTKITRILTPFSVYARTPRPYAFYQTFQNFQNIQNLPENLFAGVDTKSLTIFSSMFRETFLNYAYNTQAEDISIPADLFAELDTEEATNFSSIFQSTFSGFAYSNTKAEDISIPEGLFDALDGEKVTNFSSMFRETFANYAYSATNEVKAEATIPEELFAEISVSAGTSFGYMFQNTFQNYANKRKVEFNLDGGALPDTSSNPQILSGINAWGVAASTAEAGANPRITKDSDDIKPSYNNETGLSVANPGNPTKTSTTFIGWYADDQFETLFTFTTDKVYTADVDTDTNAVTLYAKFLTITAQTVPSTWSADALCYDFVGFAPTDANDACGGEGNTKEEGFILQVTTTAENESASIPAAGVSGTQWGAPVYNIPFNWTIEWGDSSARTVTGVSYSYLYTVISHVYKEAGTYQIKITPTGEAEAGWFDAFGYGTATNNANITRILTPFSKLARTPRAYMFYYTFSNMQNILNLPENLFEGVDTSKVIDFSNMFNYTFFNYGYNGANLQNMQIPEDLFAELDTGDGENFSYMFQRTFEQYARMNTSVNDTSIPEGLFAELDTESGTNFSYMFDSTFLNYFYMNGASADIELPEELFESIDTSSGENFSHMFNRTFAYYAQAGNDDQVEIAIPEGLFASIDTSNGKDLSYMFTETFRQYAYRATGEDASNSPLIPDKLFEAINTKSGTDFSYMFYNTFNSYAYANTELSVKIPGELFSKVDTSNGENFSNMFYGTFQSFADNAAYSSDIKIPEELFNSIYTGNGKNFSYMFAYTFGNYVGSNATATDVTIPEGLFSSLDTTNGENFAYMFQSTFNGYASLAKATDISIPENLFAGLDTTNGKNFTGMFFATFVYYGNGATDAVKASATIPENLFSGIKVTNGATFTDMFNGPFTNYANKRKVTFELGNGNFSGSPDNPQILTNNAWGVKAGTGAPAMNPTIDKNSVNIKPSYYNSTGLPVADPGEVTNSSGTFEGWYKDDAAASRFIIGTDKLYTNDVSTEENNLTLYAGYGYTLTYNANSGTGNAPTGIVSCALKPGDSSCEITVLDNAGFEKKGFTFTGWNTQADGTGDAYVAGDKISISSNGEIYAVWEANTYTLTYNGNGNTGGTQPTGPHTCTVTQDTCDIDVAGNTGDFVKTGYTFDTWNTLANGSGNDYTADAKITMDGDAELYAKWNADTYTIEFDLTSAENNDAECAQFDVTYDVAVPSFTCTVPPTKANHAVDGWQIGSTDITLFDENGAIIKGVSGYTDASGKWINADGGVTLEPKWKVTAYTVTFVSNDGTSVPPKTVPVGETVDKPDDPTKTDYTFVAWYSDIDLQTEWDFETDLITEDVALYAKWVITTYTVLFNSAGGTDVESKTVQTGEKVDKPDDPTRTYYTFDAWYKDDALQTEWDFGTDVVTGNITLYAKWIIDTYTVSFVSNDGTSVPSKTVQVGEKVAKPDDPTRLYYTFVAWYKDIDLQTEWNFATDVVTEDVILYAKWVIDTYTVSFDSDGGTSIAPKTVQAGEKVDKPVNPTKADYTFVAWYKDSALQTEWNFGTDIVTSDITLYAKYMYISPTPTPTPPTPASKDAPTPTGVKLATTGKANELKVTWSVPSANNVASFKVTLDNVLGTAKNESILSAVQETVSITVQANKREAIFTNVPTGTYRVSVQAIAKSGGKSSAIIWSNQLLHKLDVAKTYSFVDLKGVAKDRANDIAWLSSVGVTIGTNCNADGTGSACKYNPTTSVNRGAMAEFLYKLSGKTVTVNKIPKISDISKLTTPRKDAIKWLASEGITVLSSGKYNPQNTVNRGAMAEFMYKLAGHPGSVKYGDAKSDHVDPKTVVAQEKILKNDKKLQALKKSNPNRYYDILWLAKMNITVPIDGKYYNPQSAVNRGAMAQFMHKLYYVMMTGQAVPASGDVPNV